jgi:hypothetical protein
MSVYDADSLCFSAEKAVHDVLHDGCLSAATRGTLRILDFADPV